MAGPSSEVVTGVDRLMNLIEKKKTISVIDAAKELSVPRVVIEEWVDFLEEQGIIDVEYKFTTPYITKKELTKPELEKKTKEFSGKREGFVRKLETVYKSIDSGSAMLKQTKEGLDLLSKELEQSVEQIKKQLELLQKYEQLKKNLDKDIIASQTNFKGEIEKMDKEILGKKSEYEGLSKHVKEQELKIDEEIAKAQLIPKNESILRSRIRKIQEEAKALEMQLSAGNKAAELGKKLRGLKDMAMKIEEGLSFRQKQIAPLLEKSREQGKKIEELQKNLIDKVMDSKKESKKTALNQVKSKLQKFFAYKDELNSTLKKINADFEQIKAELKALYDEAQAIRLTSKSPKTKDYIAELEKKFKQIEKKKSIFESEITRLWSLLAGKA